MKKAFAFGVLLLAFLLPSPAPAYLLNLSARVEIPSPRLGEDVTSFIGGFIVGSQKSRKILVRAIGPSLADFGLVALADPKLSLYDAAGVLLAANDNWKDTQETEIFNTGLAPSNLLESGIVITLEPGSYTAIVQGQNVSAGGVDATTGTASRDLRPRYHRDSAQYQCARCHPGPRHSHDCRLHHWDWAGQYHSHPGQRTLFE